MSYKNTKSSPKSSNVLFKDAEKIKKDFQKMFGEKKDYENHSFKKTLGKIFEAIKHYNLKRTGILSCLYLVVFGLILYKTRPKFVLKKKKSIFDEEIIDYSLLFSYSLLFAFIAFLLTSIVIYYKKKKLLFLETESECVDICSPKSK